MSPAFDSLPSGAAELDEMVQAVLWLKISGYPRSLRLGAKI